MKFPIELRDWVSVKGYGFLSFSKNMSKCLSSKWGQKQTASKKAIQKTAEATVDLGENTTAEKMSKSSCKDQVKSKVPLQLEENHQHQYRYQKKYTYDQRSDSKLLMTFDYHNYNKIAREQSITRSWTQWKRQK